MQDTINQLMSALKAHDFMYEYKSPSVWTKGDNQRYDIRVLIRELRLLGMQDSDIEQLILNEFPVLKEEDYQPVFKAMFPAKDPKPGDRFIYTKRAMTRSARLGTIDSLHEVTQIIGDICECTDLESGGWKSLPTMEVAWKVAQYIPAN